MTQCKKSFVLLMAGVFLLLSVLPAAAQPVSAASDIGALPRVGVSPLEMNDPDNIQLNIISQRVRDTAVLILRYLDNYEFQRDALPQPGDYDNASLLEYCETHRLDSLVYGKTYQRADSSFIIEMSVYSRDREETTLTRIEEAATALDIFEAADNITYSLIEGFSGRRIAFGRIILEPAGAEGNFIPFIDGEEYPVNTRLFDRLLIGQRQLKVLQVRMLGETEILSSVVEVREEETAAVKLSIPYLLAAEENLIQEQAEIIERYRESSAANFRDRPRVVTAYNRIDALLINTNYNQELINLREQYRKQRAEWEALIAAADAEPAGRREFIVGVRGGGAIGRLGVDKGDDEDSSTFFYEGEFVDSKDFDIYLRPMVSVFAEYQLTRNLYLQAEFGARQLLFGELQEQEIAHQIYYYKIPVMVKPKIRTGFGNINLLFGLSYNIIMMNKSAESGSFIAQGDDSEFLTSWNVNEKSFSPVVGIEYSINRGRHNFYAGARASSFKLVDYDYRDEAEDIGFFSEIEAIDYEISLGYGYNFGGTGEIKSSRERLEKSRWLFPAGLSVISWDMETITPMALFGILYRFTDTFYAGITPGMNSDGSGGALLSFAWARDPDKMINSFSFIAVPTADRAFFGAFYNIALNRYYIGPITFFDTAWKNTAIGIAAGYYF